MTGGLILESGLVWTWMQKPGQHLPDVVVLRGARGYQDINCQASQRHRPKEKQGETGLGPPFSPRQQAEECHHPATVCGLTSHTHSFNKYLLSAYLCKAL